MEVVHPEERDDVYGGPLPSDGDALPMLVDDTDEPVDEAPSAAAAGDADIDAAYDTAILGVKPGEGGARPLTYQIVQACLSQLKHTAQVRLAYTTATLNSLSLNTVQPLAKFPHVQKLLLDLNQLTDISPLAACTSLVTVSLAHNQLDNSCFAALDGAKVTLQYLDVSGNNITSLSGVGRFRFLNTLLADDNGITTIEDSPQQLGNLHSLWRLSLAANDIKQIAPRAFAHSPLRSVNLSRNHLASLSPLLPLAPTLTSLLLEENNVMHIQDIAEFKNLVLLELAGNNIYELGETALLSRLPLLRTTTLVGNPLCSVNAVPDAPIEDDDDGDCVRRDGEDAPPPPGSHTAKKRKQRAPSRFVPAAERVAALREEKNAPYEPLAAHEEDEADLDDKDEEQRYRLQVIWRVPQIAALDGVSVSAEERAEAQNLVGGVDREKRIKAQRLLKTEGAAGSAARMLRKRAPLA